jgi:hypothetical protein
MSLKWQWCHLLPGYEVLCSNTTWKNIKCIMIVKLFYSKFNDLMCCACKVCINFLVWFPSCVCVFLCRGVSVLEWRLWWIFCMECILNILEFLFLICGLIHDTVSQCSLVNTIYPHSRSIVTWEQVHGMTALLNCFHRQVTLMRKWVWH